MNKKQEALEALESTLIELESPNGSIASAVLKLSRASRLLDNKEVYAWSQVQLANNLFIVPLAELYSLIIKENSEGGHVNLEDDVFSKHLIKMNELNIPLFDINESLPLKTNDSTGGFNSVDFIEKKLTTLNKEKGAVLD